MASVGAVDHRERKTKKLNIRKYTIFVFLSMLCFIAGFFFLRVESGRSVNIDIENMAYQTFKLHHQKLDAIGKKLKIELDVVKEKSYSRGNH